MLQAAVASRLALQGTALPSLPSLGPAPRRRGTQLTCRQLLLFSDLLQSPQESIDVGFDLRQLSFDCVQLAALHLEEGRKKGS